MPVRSILLVALLFVAAPVAAQQQAIETQMTPEELKAAGLDKLNAEELARLNTWLGRTIEDESAKAAAEARVEAQEKSRGLPATREASQPFESRIVGAFPGFERGREYTLENGQVWRQVDTATLPGVRLDGPAVRLNPVAFSDSWFIRVEGYNTRAKVKRVR